MPISLSTAGRLIALIETDDIIKKILKAMGQPWRRRSSPCANLVPHTIMVRDATPQ
jgi:hypothetical protein